jgi:xylulose-5-phosphate/fructose-6-phosphate phosphoketolase
MKPQLLGHWGTTPGLNFIYVHCNRIIREKNLMAPTSCLTLAG